MCDRPFGPVHFTSERLITLCSSCPTSIVRMIVRDLSFACICFFYVTPVSNLEENLHFYSKDLNFYV